MRRKILIMMLFVACFGVLPSHGQDIDPNEKVTLSFSNEPLTQVLQRLETMTSYKFLYTYDDVSKYRVSGKMRSETLENVLKQVLEGTPLEYSAQGKFINNADFRKVLMDIKLLTERLNNKQKLYKIPEEELPAMHQTLMQVISVLKPYTNRDEF